MTAASLESFRTFGSLLHYLRRRARLTQRELAITVGYSEAHISRLESDQRLPDMTTLIALIIPALDLDADALAVARLVELAAAARGESLNGTSVTLSQTAERRTTSAIGAIEAVPPLPTVMVEGAALARLRERLHHERTLLLCGWAGVGKTTLAAALAHSQTAKPVFWLTLTTGITASVDVLIRQLALFLLSLGDDTLLTLAEHAPDADAALPLDQQMTMLSGALARRSALLCFDNVQVISDDPALLQVIQHLAACSPATILLISREQLELPGVGSFTLDGLTVDEARSLLDGLHAQLSPAQAQGLIACTGGNPMLVRLALGQCRDPASNTLLIEHLATEPQVANYLVQTTLAQVAPDTRTLIDWLAVIGQPVNLYDEALLELIQSVDGPDHWTSALAELSRRHLIDHPARATLPPLLRDHVYATMIGKRERRRRLHHITAEWLERTAGDAVAAARHYVRAGALQSATVVLSSQIEAVLMRGQAYAAAAVVDEMLVVARRTDQELLLPLLNLRGDLLVHTLRAAEAETNYREALTLTTQPTVRAHLVWRMAGSLLQRGHVAETLRLTEESAAALAPSDALLRAYLATTSSKALLMLSRLAEAEARASEALLLATSFNGNLGPVIAEIRARAGATVAIVMQITGRRDAAIAQWLQVIAAAAAAGLERIRPRCIGNLANIQFEQGQFTATLNSCHEALAGLRQIGDSYALARVLHTLSLIHHARAEWRLALTMIDESCAIKRTTGDRQGVYNSLNQRANVLIAMGHVVEAQALAEQILVESGATAEPRSSCMCLHTLAMCQLLLGNYSAAAASLALVRNMPVSRTDDRINHFLRNRQGVLALLQDGPAAATQVLAETLPPATDLETMLEHQLVLSLVALVQGQGVSVHALTDRVAKQAIAAEYPLYRMAAQRIATATPAMPLARLPWLLWCATNEPLLMPQDQPAPRQLLREYADE